MSKAPWGEYSNNISRFHPCNILQFIGINVTSNRPNINKNTGWASRFIFTTATFSVPHILSYDSPHLTYHCQVSFPDWGDLVHAAVDEFTLAAVDHHVHSNMNQNPGALILKRSDHGALLGVTSGLFTSLVCCNQSKIEQVWTNLTTQKASFQCYL